MLFIIELILFNFIKATTQRRMRTIGNIVHTVVYISANLLLLICKFYFNFFNTLALPLARSRSHFNFLYIYSSSSLSLFI